MRSFLAIYVRVDMYIYEDRNPSTRRERERKNGGNCGPILIMFISVINGIIMLLLYIMDYIMWIIAVALI